MPPSIVLEVLRILKAEVDLRDLTRATEQARLAFAEHEYKREADSLEQTQKSLAERTLQVILDLEDLQEAQQKNFGREIKQLEIAEMAMRDAKDLMDIPDTGSPTVAAETEAIEALLQTKKINPKGSGGGGGTSPGGGGAPGESDLLASALARLGTGKAAGSRIVRQSTGTTLSDVPDEYRRGLDAYFNAIEDGADR